MHISGYSLALVIGFVLGILGGGGAMLAVPVLVYLFGNSAEQATAYSLFIIGVTSLVSTAPNTARGLVAYRPGLVFAVPALAVSYAMRWVVKHLPAMWVLPFGMRLEKEFLILAAFVAVMLPVGLAMIRRDGVAPRKVFRTERLKYFRIVWQGAVTGLVTGFVGAGGGFLIVPALTLLVGLPIRQAIATSLMVVTINTLGAFVADLQSGRTIDWPFLLGFSGLAIVGMLVGMAVVDRIPTARLRPIFGYFILVMAALMLLLEGFGVRQ